MYTENKKVTIGQQLRDSSNEMKNIRSLIMIALFVSLNIVVGTYGSFYIMPNIKFEVVFLVVGLCAMFYGPVATGFAGIIADLIKFVIYPDGIFFPGFTLNEFLAGFIMGLILYKKPVSVKRAFFSRFFVTVIVNLVLTPIWLKILYGKAVWAYMPARVIKNLVLLPFETAILYWALKASKKVEVVAGVRQ